MNRKYRLFALVTVLAFVAVLAGFSQQKADDKAVDPVCGMTVVKANAKATYEYKGETYYFCNPGCKEAFAKEPEKYLKKQAEKKADAAPAHQHQAAGQKADMPHQMHQMHGETMGEGMSCPFYSKDVQMAVEKTADGVTIKITSQNPESVKAIQEHAAMMLEKKSAAKDMPTASCPGCPNMATAKAPKK